MQSSSLNEANSELFDGRIISPFQRPFLLLAACPVTSTSLELLPSCSAKLFFSVCQNYYHPENYLYLLKNALSSHKGEHTSRSLSNLYQSADKKMKKESRKRVIVIVYRLLALALTFVTLHFRRYTRAHAYILYLARDITPSHTLLLLSCFWNVLSLDRPAAVAEAIRT